MFGGMEESRAWGPWWSVVLAVVALASLVPALVISLVWRDLGFGAPGWFGQLLELAGTVGLVVVAVLAAAWTAFLVLRRRVVFVVAAVLTLGFWGWVALS